MALLSNFELFFKRMTLFSDFLLLMGKNQRMTLFSEFCYLLERIRERPYVVTFESLWAFFFFFLPVISPDAGLALDYP